MAIDTNVNMAPLRIKLHQLMQVYKVTASKTVQRAVYDRNLGLYASLHRPIWPTVYTHVSAIYCIEVYVQTSNQ